MDSFNSLMRLSKPKLLIKKIKVLRFNWDFIIAARFYLIICIGINPLIYFITHLTYFSILGMMSLGISILLLLKYVFLTNRRISVRSFNLMMIVLFIITINFVFGLIIYYIHGNLYFFFMLLGFLLCSLIFFIIMMRYKLLTKMNASLNAQYDKWKNTNKGTLDQKTLFNSLLLLWLIISMNLIILPYPFYILENGQSYFTTKINPHPQREFGIWTYGQSLNDKNSEDPEYISDKALEMLADSDVYLIYGLNEEKLESRLIKNLNRCRDNGIEVHISINPTKDAFTNIWTFNSLKDEVIEILDYLQFHDFMNETITTLVYDMEAPPKEAFPHYGLNMNKVIKLRRYFEIQDDFERFNRKLRKDYDLKVRITTDISQGIDRKDGDIDLSILSGLMYDEHADMAYMIYRRNLFGRNHILDALKVLNDEDIIILNAWRELDHHCWDDIECAIEDARLVLGYPEKSYKLEIWELASFLYSFGEKGLYSLVDAINERVSEWDNIRAWNFFPYSLYWECVFLGMMYIDLFGSLLRIIFLVF